MAKRPEDRYSSPIEVVEALESFIGETVPLPTEREVPWPCPLVRQLLPTGPSRVAGRIKRPQPISPFKQGSVPDMLTEPPLGSYETDTLKDEARSKSPTKVTEKQSIPQPGFFTSLTQKQLMLLASVVALITVLVTIIIMLLVLR
jgi:hypothetical protein